MRDVDTSEAKRWAIEVIGRLAVQLDAWILAEGVSSSAELRALAGLDVPLAQGPFIGTPHEFWPSIELTARTALPARDRDRRRRAARADPAGLHAQDAVAAAAVLPETSGFDVVVVLDEHRRPQSILEHDGSDPGTPARSWRSTSTPLWPTRCRGP